MTSIFWRSTAVCGFGLVGLGAVAGTGASLAIFLCLAAACSITVLVAIRLNQPSRRDPWILYAICAGLFLISNGTRWYITTFGYHANGSTTLADYIEPLGFLAAIVATHRLGQLRDGDKDPTTILDAFILTGGVTAVLWGTIMLPYVQDPGFSESERAIGVVSTSLTMWLIWAIVRLAIGPGIRTIAMRPLALAALFGSVSDALEVPHSSAPGVGTLMFGSLSLLCLALAALHPSMKNLTLPASRGIARMTATRLVFTTAAVISAPIMIVATAGASGRTAFYIGVIGSWIVVTALVMTRLAGLVRARERVAEVERTLNRAAASLVSAMDRDSTFGAALTAMQELAGESEGLRVSVALASDSGWLIVDARGHESDLANGRPLDGLLMESTLNNRPNSPVQLNDTFAIDNPNAGRCSMIAAPLLSHGQIRGALMVSTYRPLPSLVVEAFGSLASDVALAIEVIVLAEDLHRRRSEQRFRALVENSADVIIVFSGERAMTFASPAAERFVGSKTLFVEFLDMVHYQDAENVRELITTAKRHGHHDAPLLFRATGDSGQERWFEGTATDLSEESEVEGVVLNARDVTERRKAEEQRDQTDARFRSLVQHSSDLTAVLDHRGLINYVSPSAQSILGRPPELLIGTDLSEIMHPDDVHVISELVGFLVHGTSSTKRIELRIAGPREDWKTLDVTLTDLRHEPSVNGIVMNAHDVTERKVLEFDLLHKVLHDDLTGIPNRVLFRERVDHALKSRRESGGALAAVLFIDIDDFKTVNDGLGHDVGDELLRLIAFRLETFVRSGDTAARLGGDEFAILFENLYTPEDVMNASRRLLEILNQPIEFGRRKMTVGASIGIALAEFDMTSEVLLRNADVAMYHAKQTGKNCVKTFDERMHESAFERLELKADLVNALDRKELTLYYQPLLALGSGTVVGFEALLRWKHPSRGMVSPASFIPLAEETGLIVRIGEWALNEAARQLKIWRNEIGSEVGMSVNVSPRQLQDENIVDVVRRAIEVSAIEPSWLTLELTESSGLEDATTRTRLVELRSLGCEVAADDFGTGFASYAALQQLPFTNVKIDKSLIDGLAAADKRAHAQVQSIITMGHALGLTITAEGIEEPRQADALQVLGADKGQGFLFGRPVPALDAIEFLKVPSPYAQVKRL